MSFRSLVHMIILPRNGDQPSHKNLDTFKIADNIDQLRANSNGHLYFSNAQLIDISSSDIRGKICRQSKS